MDIYHLLHMQLKIVVLRKLSDQKENTYRQLPPPSQLICEQNKNFTKEVESIYKKE